MSGIWSHVDGQIENLRVEKDSLHQGIHRANARLSELHNKKNEITGNSPQAYQARQTLKAQIREVHEIKEEYKDQLGDVQRDLECNQAFRANPGGYRGR